MGRKGGFNALEIFIDDSYAVVTAKANKSLTTWYGDGGTLGSKHKRLHPVKDLPPSRVG